MLSFVVCETRRGQSTDDVQIPPTRSTLDRPRLRAEDAAVVRDEGGLDQHGQRGQVLSAEILQV